MEQETDTERNEVYERIPWETLEQQKPDRQWLMFAVGGAVVLGALAYSFMSNRPPTDVVAQPAATTAPPIDQPQPLPTAPPPTPQATSPVVVSEADLYAVDPERMVDQAIAHAEWFIAEYFTVDGSEEHRSTLESLMPAGVPIPPAPDGVAVFVESARAKSLVELDSLRYEVEVLVRYLVANGEDVYRRQAPVIANVEVAIGDAGARVISPPILVEAPLPERELLVLGEIPAAVADAAGAMGQVTEIVGGEQSADGTWRVVALMTGSDGISRPVSLRVP